MDKPPEKKLFRNPETNNLMRGIYDVKVKSAMENDPMWAHKQPKYQPGQTVLLMGETDIEQMQTATVEETRAGVYLCTYVDKNNMVQTVVCEERFLGSIE